MYNASDQTTKKSSKDFAASYAEPSLKPFPSVPILQKMDDLSGDYSRDI